jgi:Mycothiol maleylpyruvate isomerase N-terminal domain
VRSLDEADWDRPTDCTGWPVRQLTGAPARAVPKSRLTLAPGPLTALGPALVPVP